MPEQNGDDFTPEVVQRMADQHEQAEKDLVPIRKRIDALNEAIFEEDWCPSRVVQGELSHLNNVLNKYHVAKYLEAIRQTLDDAEADLARWRKLSPAAQTEIVEADERAEAERAEWRQKQAEISKRQDAFYSAFFAMGISPIPMSAVSIAESARTLNDHERQISNMGNHLHE